MSRSYITASKLDVGTVLSIPCDVSKGPLPTERVFQCTIDAPPHKFDIEGIVSPELTQNDKRVVGVVSEKAQKGFVTVMFSGEIYTGNPVKIPTGWLIANAQIELVAA